LTPSSRPVLYVSHNSIGTALVRSQVLAYARGLLPLGFATDLITFERGGTFPDGEFPRERWHPIRARAGASLAAKALDIITGTVLAIRLAAGRHARLIHARSYVPAAIALVAGAVTRRPYIFDMRGFLPEEYVDAGYWRTTDLRYRVLRLAERALLRRAAHIVVLTEAAARRLRTEPRYARLVGNTPVTAIPCAVDLDRFHPVATRASAPTLIYTGSLGSFYELDPMLAVYRSARALLPGLRFVIVNRGEQDLVRSSIARVGLDGADIELRSADFAEMPGLVAAAHVGIALIRQSPSKVGSSAVKIAEYFACGLPVVVNAGLGDVDAQVREHEAGHVMPGYGSDDVAMAGRALAALVGDEGARARARALAESAYDVRAATARYAEVYSRVAGASTT
jgi:glycosyltransferase involved in cell wall biosynthesis